MYLSLLAVFHSAEVRASEALSVHAHSGVAVGTNDEQIEAYYRVGFGYDISDIWMIGLSFSYIDGDGANWAPEPFMRARYMVENDTSLYAEVGRPQGANNLSAGVGLLHQLTSSLQLNAGYRWYDTPNQPRQGDAFVFSLGGEYRPVQQVAPVTKVKLRPAEQEPIITPTDSPEPIRCHYSIAAGDYLNLIAQNHGTDLKGLVEDNAWLERRESRAWIIFPDEVLQVPCT
ncbi:hypothetical protein PO80_02495 [Vibrio parahaemolyticus]|nr:hypothetical protein PO80_02495 [Vibrio parahaemolyticus]OTV96536.1 hypothetical protein BA739_23165 [Vibrio parahaemolyticus]OTW00267.1 hypothetical protein BA740_23840 [Vibrio parahaemolyticus]